MYIKSLSRVIYLSGNNELAPTL